MYLRSIYSTLEAEKNSKKASILIGPRQVGKTTLLKKLHKALGGVFLDLDVFSNIERVSSYENAINTLKIEGYEPGQKKTFYLFLDEFQRYTDLTRVFKNLIDHHQNIKIYATGSSSLTIKNQIQESLAGRKHVTYIYPLSFIEYLIFKNQEGLVEKIKKLKKIKSEHYFNLIPELKSLFEDFMIYGGYPEVVLARTEKQKKEVLESIFDLYAKKDLVDYLKIEKIREAKSLIEGIAVNHGGIANFTALAIRAQLNTKTAMNYAEILKETFILNIIRPYFKNKNKEISKAPKLYFVDNGVRNYFINNFNPLKLREDAGVLFESFYISELLKWGQKRESIKYYRTKNQAEVDVILDQISEVVPIELKYNERPSSKQDLNNLKAFMKEFELPEGFLVNMVETGLKTSDIKKIDCFNNYFLK